MDDFFELNPDVTIIEIPNIKQELTLLHVTDVHLTEADQRDPDALENAEKRRIIFDRMAPEHFSRKKYLEDIVSLSNKINADAVIFTGDIIDFPSTANLETLKGILDHLLSPYLFTMGNHDWHFSHLPWNERTRAEYYMKFSGFSQGNPSFQIMDISGVRLIAVDNSNYQIDGDQLKQFRSALCTSDPCFVFMHIPVFLRGLAIKTIEHWNAPILMAAEGWDSATREKWRVREADQSTLEFYKLLTNEQPLTLHGIFSGHVHFEHEEALAGGCVQYVTKPGYAGGVRIVRIVPSTGVSSSVM